MIDNNTYAGFTPAFNIYEYHRPFFLSSVTTLEGCSSASSDS